MNPLRLAKFVLYGISTVHLNWRFRIAPKYQFPFFPLLVCTGKVRCVIGQEVEINRNGNAYLRFGYEGSGGVASFDWTGINFEMYDRSSLSLDGKVMIGNGGAICCYPDAKLRFGDNTYIAGNTVIKCAKRVSIGSNCAISWNVTIIDSDFHPWSCNGEEQIISKEVIIEDNVWIGNNVIILKGVTIGSGAIVGAGSVVVENVPQGVLVVGNPARVIKENVAWK